jgi:hypothetical protein
VKGCRRPLFLGGRCGYHALQLAGVRGAAHPHVAQAGPTETDRRAPYGALDAIH